MKTILGLFITAILVLGMVSCATSVPIYSVERPAIDTSNVKTLAIKPFENTSGVTNNDTAQLTRYLAEKAQTAIKATGKFTIVALNDPNADGVFSGELTKLISQDSQSQRQVKNRDGSTSIVNDYKREVSLDFLYSIISTRDGMPVGSVSRRGNTSDNASGSPGNLDDTQTLGRSIIDKEMQNLANDIVPHVVSTKKNLMEETSKDKVVKDKMKAVKELVKKNSYQAAIDEYTKIYNEHGSTAANTNAQILRESIESNRAANAGLSQMLAEQSGLKDKAIKDALSTLYAKVPAGTSIVVMEGNSTDRNIIVDVVSQMTKSLVQDKKLTVVDRQNQAFVQAEMKFQTETGYVSDASMISLGKQIGVKYLVVCSVSGQMSGRKLNQKIINIETGETTDATDYPI